MSASSPQDSSPSLPLEHRRQASVASISREYRQPSAYAPPREERSTSNNRIQGGGTGTRTDSGYAAGRAHAYFQQNCISVRSVSAGCVDGRVHWPAVSPVRGSSAFDRAATHDGANRMTQSRAGLLLSDYDPYTGGAFSCPEGGANGGSQCAHLIPPSFSIAWVASAFLRLPL